MKLYALLGLSLVCTIQSAKADTFTLSNNQSGLQYYCANGTNPNPQPVDPNCITDVSTYCSRITIYTNAVCFDKATAGCHNGGAKFSGCVQQTTDYCNRNTSLTASACFDRSLDACKGGALGIQGLMEATQIHKLLK